MVVGYHVIFGAYGFWLPNDPRGSWSEFVGSWELYRHGAATKTDVRRSVARQTHDVRARVAAKESLKRPAVRFTGLQARAIGVGFGEYVRRSAVPIWACAILPDHVHLVVGRCDRAIEQIATQLKGAAARRLIEENLHPFGEMTAGTERPPKCFARGEWKVFLDTSDVPRAIRYVEHNPVKEGRPIQRWTFVTSPG